ncbi:MAG: AraC family transcriptional regulator [Rhizobium sp.]|jgi:AraC family transcriptional regulator|uniref:AraC family transcriptional regulator n=1 Tax=Thiobacillus sp. TaxID=924 RepID=UPI00260120B3|nr:AraC family transcriptional regulator [Thiobacillus sp.]MBW8365172.1 AraC family transcriptional regulator [Rhizobium sp.]
MNDTKAKAYAARFGKVLDYIETHLDEVLSVEQLSRIANFSKYHFHRQFAEHTGVSVFRYIQLLRLRQATYRLAFDHGARIIDIALEAGFENPESFSRAFRNTFEQSPSEFRRHPKWETWHARYRFRTPERKQTMEVEIVDFETTRIAVQEHRGPIELLNDTVGQFIIWRKANGLSPVKTSRTFGIAYDNPDTTEPEKFRFDICGEVTGEVPANPQGVVAKIIPGGRCARVRHRGTHTRLGESAIYPLYRDWLPASGEELRDFPLYFHYLNLLPETPEHELVTDVYLPLK